MSTLTLSPLNLWNEIDEIFDLWGEEIEEEEKKREEPEYVKQLRAAIKDSMVYEKVYEIYDEM